MLKLGWFSTGRGEGSRGLLSLVQKRITTGDLPTAIEFVFQNREQGEAEGSDQFQDLVRSYGIPLVSLSSQRFRKERGARTFAEVRLEFDREVMDHLEDFHPDLCVLAGYMLILGPELDRRFNAINLHPALPEGPTGTWQQVIWRLIEQRATETGAMIHLCTDDLDRGPAITYYSFSLTGPLFDPLWEQVHGRTVDELKTSDGEELPLFQRIRAEGVRREPYLLLETIRAFAQGTIKVVDREVTDAAGKLMSGYRLNEKIEGALKGS